MLSIQHVLSAYIAKDGDKDWMDRHMAGLLFPDAIRAYSGPRGYSHFEKSSDGTDVSYWKMPSDMKNVSPESVKDSLSQDAHLAFAQPCVLGEDTDVNAFLQHNGHLPRVMHESVRLHLEQDVRFDKLVREKIDCTNKYDDRFVYKNQVYTGKEIRGKIGEMEQQGIYAAAKLMYERYGEVIDSQWIEQNVRPVLERDYPQDLADKTLSFMKISPEIEGYIRQQDWSHLQDGPLSEDTWQRLYDGLRNCPDIVSDFNWDVQNDFSL